MSYTQYQEYGGNPYQSGPNAEAGIGGPPYGSQNRNEYGSQHAIGHELTNTSNYSQPGAPASQVSSSTVLSQREFLDRAEFAKSEIRALSTNIQDIASLHQHALSQPDSQTSNDLEALVARTQLKNTQIRDQIKRLELDAVKTQDGTKATKNIHAKRLKGEFEQTLKDYQREEVEYRRRYREQIARQYRIANPQATDREVEEASDLDWGSEGVFQTALKSNRSGQASSVLGGVRARHNELQRIEATLAELGALFADMAQIVEAQDPIVEHTEQNAIKTVDHVNGANKEIDNAKDHAARTRKLKWWCLGVTILIILAIALGVGLGVGLATRTTSTATGA